MSMDAGLEALEALGKNHQSLAQGIKHLRVIEAWALEQQPVHADDAVTIKSSFPPVGGGNGWSSYREALVPGATGVVTDVTYNDYHHYWGAQVRLDVEWSRYDGSAMLEKPHLFYINVSHLRPRRKTDNGLTAPEGAMTWEQHREAEQAKWELIRLERAAAHR